MGTDFTHQNANLTYWYIEKIIRILKSTYIGSDLKFYYSTVQEYYNAVQQRKKEMNFEWPIYKDDFLPYNGNFPQHYWTGFFSSRPGFKKLIKDYSSIAHSSLNMYTSDILTSNYSLNLKSNYPSIAFEVKDMLRNLAIMVHHDTITGTSPNFVIQSHAKRLDTSLITNSKTLNLKFLDKIKVDGISSEDLYQCINKLYKNKICPLEIGQSSQMLFVVYNPSVKVANYTQLQFPTNKLQAQAWDKYQNQFIDIAYEIICAGSPLTGLNQYSQMFFIMKQLMLQVKVSELCNSSLSISNNMMTIKIITCTMNSSIIFGVKFKNESQERRFEFDFRFYTPYNGYQLKPSGIYVFKTSDKDSSPYVHSISSIQVFRGKKMQQFVIRYQNEMQPPSIVKIKLFHNSDEIEFDVFLARLNKNFNSQGQDVTINWKSLDIDQNGTFFTDANSFKVMKREVNQTKFYIYNMWNKQFTVAQEFYPITSGLFISDQENRTHFMVFNDRPQGGSAYQKGRLELMINRFGFTTDDLGVSDPMQDYSIDNLGINVTAKFWVSYANNRLEALEKLQKRHLKNQNPQDTFYGTQVNFQEIQISDINNKIKYAAFEKFTNQYLIKHIQLLPMNQFEDMFLQVTRFQDNQPIDIKQLYDQLCSYILLDNCKMIQKLQRVHLDGLDKSDQQKNQTFKHKDDIYVVENYRIIIQ
ncbi:glycosyl hydrolases family 38 protein [Stylonychia lemnae]|uniref:Glycosyl hydrolases family 38 protein n=1 Tax=Stylonychia lemnae TaxID=5949 RepID=A0A078BEC1_STYLE|nr:glycosyl hydrolases family 38 protein [Stylonychia lemnae]|eukprot:CDW91487.1 glycosyl hydrolases family 38 protein [Stylonychia lemnae]